MHPNFRVTARTEIRMKKAEYGWCDDSHIVIGTEDKEILIFDQTSAITPLDEKEQRRTDLEYSKFLGMQKISLHKNGTEIVLFQTDATEYIIRFFLYLILAAGFVGITLGAIKQQYLGKDTQ